MSTKNNPGAFDCYANAAPDEEMFVLLGRDVSAPQVVENWALMRAQQIAVGFKPKEDIAMVNAALDCADKMRAWRKANRPDDVQTSSGRGQVESLIRQIESRVPR